LVAAFSAVAKITLGDASGNLDGTASGGGGSRKAVIFKIIF
jgi:hypothetical protein